MKRKQCMILAVLLFFSVFCRQESGVSAKMKMRAENTHIKKLTLNYKTLRMKIGEKKRLRVKSVKPKKASKKVKWSSSDKEIVTVNNKGTVKAKRAGTVTITATPRSGGKKAKCKVIVRKKETAQVEDKKMTEIEVIINGKTFPAKLYNNKTARELQKKFPLTLKMSELNGNEKYHYMDSGLPAAAVSPKQIRKGELMLYGSDCLVLFYKSFSTSYDYTRLGYLENTDGLAEAVGTGDVQMTFRMKYDIL